jgi:hydroxymethylbilane synthase
MTEVWRVAARGSPLSRRQVELAEAFVRGIRPDVRFEPLWRTSRGDRDQEHPFGALGERGIFVKEVDACVLSGESRVAVHSLKDIPTDLRDPLTVWATPPRESPCDVLVGRRPWASWEELPEGFRLGTSSPRRQAMALYRAPQARIVPLRGNVQTRLQRLREGFCDGVLLAEAGLLRLGLSWTGLRIDPTEDPPAPGQGVIALVGRGPLPRDLAGLREASEPTLSEVAAERSFLRSMGGGCSDLVGAFAKSDGTGGMTLHVVQYEAQGQRRRIARAHGRYEGLEALGVEARHRLEAATWEDRREGS